VKGTCYRSAHAIVCISLNSLVPARSCVLIGGDFTKDIVATFSRSLIILRYCTTIVVNNCVSFDDERIYKFIYVRTFFNISISYK